MVTPPPPLAGLVWVFFSLFQVSKGEIKPIRYSYFPELNFGFKHVALFTVAEVQSLQAMIPERVGEG